MIVDGSHRHRRSDVEEQVALVDTLNMLSQLYRDQVRTGHSVILLVPAKSSCTTASSPAILWPTLC